MTVHWAVRSDEEDPIWYLKQEIDLKADEYTSVDSSLLNLDGFPEPCRLWEGTSGTFTVTPEDGGMMEMNFMLLDNRENVLREWGGDMFPLTGGTAEPFDAAVNITPDKASRTITAEYDLGREITNSPDSSAELAWYWDQVDYEHYFAGDYHSFTSGDSIARTGSFTTGVFNNPETQLILVLTIREGKAGTDGPAICYERQFTVPAADLDFDPLPENACGLNLTWAYADGTLTISGTGEMFRYRDGGTPWHDFAYEITDLCLEEGITVIPTFAFEFCGMAEVTIPDSVLTIEDEAFLECMNLQTVHIPAATKKIEPGAFYISPVREITVDSGNPYYFVRDGMLMNTNATEIIVISRGLTDVEIPEGITKLPFGAFLGMHLNSLTLHEGIQNLGDFHFQNARAERIILASGFETIPENAFYYAEIGELYIPSTLRTVEENAFLGEGSLSDIYYAGTAEQFAAIDVAETGNACFLNAGVHYLGPVQIIVPDSAVPGQAVEIGWNILDGNFEYASAQAIITEIKGNYRAFRTEDRELSGRSGTVTYTPTAGDTLDIRVTFTDSEGRILYTTARNCELTGVPTYDLQLIDGTVNITLNNETNELEAHYGLSGGNGSFRRLEYDWEYFLPGGGYTDFYQEGRAAIDGSSGTLKLATAMNGTYKLFLNIYDESEDSGWIKRISNSGLTINVTEGSDEVQAQILPVTLEAKEEEQELTWTVSGGFTPFYRCTAELQILDPEERVLYEETKRATVGTANVILKDAGTYSAVFTITTTDQNDNPVTLSPITIPVSVLKLKEFRLPDGLTEIGADAFAGAAIEYVICPAGLRTIRTGAFAGCSGLRCVELPDDITTIEAGAFGSGVIFRVTEGSSAWQIVTANGWEWQSK